MARACDGHPPLIRRPAASRRAARDGRPTRIPMAFPPINKALDHALTEQGYNDPTPVQSAVLDEAARGRDLLVSAQTGSGKTVAFGLAMAPAIMGEAQKLT